MPIKHKDIYVATDGSEHGDITQAIRKSENLLVDFIEKPLRQSAYWHPSLSVALAEYVLENRQELRRLLNFSSDEAQFYGDDTFGSKC